MNPWDIPPHSFLRSNRPPDGPCSKSPSATRQHDVPLPEARRRLPRNSRRLRAVRYLAGAPLVLVVAVLGYVVLTLELVLRLLADLTLRIMPPASVTEPSQANRGSAAESTGPASASDGPPPRQLFVVGDQPPCKIIPFHAGLDMSASRHSSPGKGAANTGGDAA